MNNFGKHRFANASVSRHEQEENEEVLRITQAYSKIENMNIVEHEG